ncbi:MAG: Rrf2 family transcriptional regulator [bacterium]
MRFSTRSTYGLRAMINLAEKASNISLSQISKEEHISRKYLEIIFAQLKKAKLIKSIKGATGGYSLAKPAKDISVFEIIKALERNMNVFHCVGSKGKVYCSQACDCRVNLVLAKVQNSVNKTLLDIKLSELIKK